MRPLRRCVFYTARLHHIYSRKFVGLAVILRGGRYPEKVKTPEHRPVRRRHNGSFANCLGVDAERKYHWVHQEKSESESNQPGESLPVIILDQ